MDKRSILALVLIAVVIVGGQLLMPRTTQPPEALAESAQFRPDSHPAASTIAPARAPVVTARVPSIPATRAETLSVVGANRVIQFATNGAGPIAVSLPEYPDLKRRDGALRIVANRGPLLRFRIAGARDTVSFDTLSFVASPGPSAITFTAPQGIAVQYDLMPGQYLTRTTITSRDARPGDKLLIDLAQDLRSGEADTTEDLRHLAYGYRQTKGSVESVVLQKLDTTSTVTEPGPIDWAAIRNKYFALVAISPDTIHGFAQVAMRGGHRRLDGFPTGIAVITAPIETGRASFDLYPGPQSWYALRSVGHELININPYAGGAWLRPVVQPFATIVMRLLLPLKNSLSLSYGWVLVIFGIVIRVVLWPLNQSAMRTSIKMPRLQPELTAIQKRYANDPEAQRNAMVKLYQAHGMSPFSPLMGCLPMLLPMPVLFALYFVFQNTIEFRGVSFLWLPDISLRDPYYIIPIVMGVSMFVPSWLGMRGMPPNPQAKMMSYMMPVMFTVLFWNFASGLNLYYAVQNIAALPQQWQCS